MTHRKLFEWSLKSKPKPLPGSWFDYMGKEISPELLNGTLKECVDRARIILQKQDSTHVVESHEIIEILLAIYFTPEESPGEKSETTDILFSQRVFRPGEISDALALSAVLEHLSPRFVTTDRMQQRSTNDSDEKLDIFGIDGKPIDAAKLFLASLALRDAFQSARLVADVQSYQRMRLDIAWDDETEFDDLLLECEDQAHEWITEAAAIFQLAAEKAVRATEAVMYAEGIGDQHTLWAISLQKTDEARKEGGTQALSERGKLAAHSRHRRNRELREFAWDLYTAGNFKSVRQAAKAILPKVQERARELDSPLSEDRGEKTVYDWLLSTRKATPL